MWAHLNLQLGSIRNLLRKFWCSLHSCVKHNGKKPSAHSMPPIEIEQGSVFPQLTTQKFKWQSKFSRPIRLIISAFNHQYIKNEWIDLLDLLHINTHQRNYKFKTNIFLVGCGQPCSVTPKFFHVFYKSLYVTCMIV